MWWATMRAMMYLAFLRTMHLNIHGCNRQPPVWGCQLLSNPLPVTHNGVPY